MKKVGILGGTFDPIHIGHLLLAQTAYEQAQLDKVLLIPTGISYFKAHRALQVTDPQLRLAMTRAAAEGTAHFEVCDVEARRPGNSYTFETMEELHAERLDEVFYYIVGADTLCMMDKWREPERMFRACRILVTERSDQIAAAQLEDAIRNLSENYGAVIERIHLPAMDLSSTQIRERVRSGKPIRWMVPEAVEQFIAQHGLYCE